MTLKYASKWKLLVFAVFAAAKVLQAVFIAYVFQEFINFAGNPKGSLLQLTIKAVVGIVLFACLALIYQIMQANIIKDVNLKIKEQATKYLLYSDNSDPKFDLSFMTNDLKQVESHRVEAELDIIFNGLQFIAAFAAAMLSSWALSLIFLVASLAPGLLQNVFGPKIEAASSAWEGENSKYTEAMTDTINFSAFARLYDAEDSIYSRMLHYSQRMETALAKMKKAEMVTTEVITSFAYVCSMIIPFSLGIYFVTQGQITLGTFMMISQLANNFINPIVGIFSSVNDIKTSNPIWEKFTAVADFTAKESAADRDEFKELSLDDASVQRGDRKLLNNLDLTVKNGEKVLLEAPSGWGKTTLLNVLVGRIKLADGHYEINGEDANGDWSKDHEYFSFVQQKPYILDDTIEYNISLGREVSREDLLAVCQKAGLTSLIEEKGLDYQVGKEGKNLSGGQGQRLEIARALLAKRPVLLADEATSALDPRLSKQIHQTILQNFPGTVIEVAHKISDEEIAMFDRVVNLAEK
ncbi:multidrug ABC transporter ATP-binding and permease protein [Lactobacillus delbrueckii]|uniref:ATP-binding cassette domain-containing protein n=1 Tax=Lactobacillus delbrueckii TaxID=1584 RepID=UPI001F2B8AE0|nr:ABC transporter ATP-binding protein [Lactobacillus delbrueckii]GHN20035.1 multidrug ABC transporter ATP-binding and permease protein [Lactobacillus delbrueckii]GHN23309.1 multidrug ABC transporter ATP-binding and permease protein [Lactobacillus delbrueckii]